MAPILSLNQLIECDSLQNAVRLYNNQGLHPIWSYQTRDLLRQDFQHHKEALLRQAKHNEPQLPIITLADANNRLYDLVPLPPSNLPQKDQEMYYVPYQSLHPPILCPTSLDKIAEEYDLKPRLPVADRLAVQNFQKAIHFLEGSSIVMYGAYTTAKSMVTNGKRSFQNLCQIPSFFWADEPVFGAVEYKKIHPLSAYTNHMKRTAYIAEFMRSFVTESNSPKTSLLLSPEDLPYVQYFLSHPLPRKMTKEDAKFDVWQAQIKPKTYSKRIKKFNRKLSRCYAYGIATNAPTVYAMYLGCEQLYRQFF